VTTMLPFLLVALTLDSERSVARSRIA